MRGTTETKIAVPKYTAMIVCGAGTAGLCGIGLAIITTYASTPGRPFIATGWTAALATLTLTGVLLVLAPVVIRAVVRAVLRALAAGKRDVDGRLAAIEQKVDSHAHHVEREHGGLHRDAIKNEERIGLLIKASTDIREQVAEISLDLSEKRLEEIAAAAARRAFRELYDAMREASRRHVAGWSPADTAWLEDVAEAFELGKQFGPDTESEEDQTP